MKRIAFVHPSAELYGSDRVLLDHLLLLDRDRYEPRVYLPAKGPLTTALTRAEIPWELREVVSLTRAARTPAGLVRAARAAPGWPRALAAAEIDLVHTSTLACLGGAIAARVLGLPHLWHVQEIPPPSAQRALAPLLAAAPGLWAANSEAVATWLRAVGRADRVRLVFPGRAAPSRVQPYPRAALGIPPEATCALLLGRLSPRKGHLLALEALELARDPRLWLLIVGDEAPGHAGYRDWLRARIARSPAWGRVRLLPGRSDPWPCYALSDLVLVPSREPESFGLVALEASLAGRAVLASDQGGLREVLGAASQGLLPPDPAAWAAAWRRLADEPPLRASWASAGQARAQRFSVEAASAELTTLYEELCF